MIPPRIVLATANPGKVRELGALVGEWGPIAVATLADVPGVALPEEGDVSYEANAAAKAVAVARAAGVPALADDSGLEVDALGGRPGVRSARWSGEPNAELLRELAGAADRRARYRCAMVAIGPAGVEVAVEGRLEGRLATEPRGSGGFGYDPIFVPEDEQRTVAELGNDWKRDNSHRARAARDLLRQTGSRGLL